MPSEGDFAGHRRWGAGFRAGAPPTIQTLPIELGESGLESILAHCQSARSAQVDDSPDPGGPVPRSAKSVPTAESHRQTMSGGFNALALALASPATVHCGMRGPACRMHPPSDPAASACG